jgi:hypothetical protein
MLPIDPGDGQGSVIPTQPARDILPAQAMTHGGTTIIRPGAIAWGGQPHDHGYPSCEAVERSLGSVIRDAGQLPGLLVELTRTRLWVPLPARRRRPFTDGTAVMLPLVSSAGTDFVPCFTSAVRLTAWADAAPGGAEPGEFGVEAADRPWRRAGDARVVPHLVVLASGLAQRLPLGLGMALNPGASPSVPLYPECVSYLARLSPHDAIATQRMPGTEPPSPGTPTMGDPPVVGHPPAEPTALLRKAHDAFRTLPPVRHASRAWLSVPGQGEGLVISVALDDPASETGRGGVIDALQGACAAVPLRVPFPVDVTFSGEDLPGEPAHDLIDDWVARNTRPFYTRGDGG